MKAEQPETEHLNQDLNEKFARWLSSRLDARAVLRTHATYTPSPDAHMTEWDVNTDQPSREG
jgi:hypothetical protein